MLECKVEHGMNAIPPFREVWVEPVRLWISQARLDGWFKKAIYFRTCEMYTYMYIKYILDGAFLEPTGVRTAQLDYK